MSIARALRFGWLAGAFLLGGMIAYLSVRGAAPPSPFFPGPGLPRRPAPGSEPSLIFLLLNWWAWLLAVLALPGFWWLSGRRLGRARWPLWAAAIGGCALVSLLTWRLGSLHWLGARVPMALLLDGRRALAEAIPFLLAALGAALLRAERTDALLRAQAAESRLTALTAQLQPHFLFNTLQAISTALHRDPLVADRMVGALSDLLRGALEGTRAPVVSLERELALLEGYLAIVRERFGDRLVATVNVPAELRATPVPVLLLQPLVENAVRHGVEGREGAATITIVARRHGGVVEIGVENSGGQPQIVPAGAGGAGVGLANTRERLEALYGGRASLNVSRSPTGTRVTVTVPMDGARLNARTLSRSAES